MRTFTHIFMTAKQIGEYLKKRRKELCYTQRTVQAISGISTPTIANVEKGIHSTSYETLSAICAALEIEITFNVKNG